MGTDGALSTEEEWSASFMNIGHSPAFTSKEVAGKLKSKTARKTPIKVELREENNVEIIRILSPFIIRFRAMT
jgi:hypothetical protein